LYLTTSKKAYFRLLPALPAKTGMDGGNALVMQKKVRKLFYHTTLQTATLESDV
jgi:hypothetical protein